jgi:thioredoxin-related protein
MTTKKIWTILALFICTIYNQNVCLANGAVSRPNIGYVEDFDLAMRLSEDTKQDILLIFSTSWCVHCNSLKKDLSKLSNLDNKIICIIDSEENTTLSKKFKVKTYPTSFLLDYTGESFRYIKGYDLDSYNRWLGQ